MKTVVEPKDAERRFRELDSSLSALIDQDPRSAIEAAHALTSDDVLDTGNIDALKAGILIDAGIEGNDVQAVDEGIALLQRSIGTAANRSVLQYCLANGLVGKADLLSCSVPEWYCVTATLRREARRLFRFAGKGKDSFFITSKALTNLGNALRRAYRFIEAYDCYLSALKADPSNGVARIGAARILLRFVNEGIGDRDVLLGVAAQHLRTAQENPDRIRKLAGERAYRQLSELMNTKIVGGTLPDLSSATDYQRFVAKHRLALAPTIEGLDLSMSHWDSLRIERITEPINTEYDGVPPIFAMFNILKSDYLTARFLAYLGLEGKLVDSGKYSDTLDYASYGIWSSVLTLSQRSCLDLLDKTAIAASEYLGLPGGEKSVGFLTRWFVRPKEEPPLWQPGVRDEIISGNTAVIALSEASYDIAEGGFLHEKRSIRNTSTHRFTVLHDFGSSMSRKCRYIDHFNKETFADQLIETLQLTRAILFYFVNMIKIRENRLASDGCLKVPLIVPDHG